MIDSGELNLVIIRTPQEIALFSVLSMSGLEQIVAFSAIYPGDPIFPLKKFNVFSKISSFYKYLFFLLQKWILLRRHVFLNGNVSVGGYVMSPDKLLVRKVREVPKTAWTAFTLGCLLKLDCKTLLLKTQHDDFGYRTHRNPVGIDLKISFLLASFSRC